MARRAWTTIAMVLMACDGGSDHDAPGADAGVDSGNDAGVDAGGDGDADADPWDVTVTLEVGPDATPVGLAALERTTFEGAEALRVTRIVEAIALELPWSYLWDFVGSDGWDPLVERMDGDRSGLPTYGELSQGFLSWQWDEDAQADTLQLGWEAALDFPGYLRVSAMAGGTIRALEISADELLVQAPEVRSLVDLTLLPTTEIIDYQQPEEGNKTVVTLPDVFAAAGLADATGLVFKIWGKDGFANADDNLMPAESAAHGYIELGTKHIYVDEEWDTDECCWRVYDVVLIRGQAP